MAIMYFRCHLSNTQLAAHISVLFVVPFPRPSNTQYERLVIRSRVCRIERTPSRTKRCQRWVLDAPTGLVMVLDDAALALGEPLLCAFTSVISKLYLHTRGGRTACRIGTSPWFTDREPKCGRGWRSFSFRAVSPGSPVSPPRRLPVRCGPGYLR